MAELGRSYNLNNLREHGSSGAVNAAYTWVNTGRLGINGRRVWFRMGGIRVVESEERVTACGEAHVGVCAEGEVPRATRRSRWGGVVNYGHVDTV